MTAHSRHRPAGPAARTSPIIAMEPRPRRHMKSAVIRKCWTVAAGGGLALRKGITAR